MKGTHRLASLDLLRGTAALCVALPHYLVLSSVASDTAEIVSVLAVEVFFVLSGFVLAPQILFCVRTAAWRNLGVFLMRRWMRTIPPYVFALGAISMLVGNVSSADLIRYAFYVQNLFTQSNGTDYFPIAWSLSVEEWFYVTFPLTALIALAHMANRDERKCAAVALCFIATVTVARVVFGDLDHWGDNVRRVVVFRIDSIAYGFLLYLLVNDFAARRVAKANLLLLCTAVITAVGASVIAFAGTSAIATGKDRLSEQLFPFYAAGFGMALVFLFYTMVPIIQSRAWLSTASLFVGRISYSVYLFHIIIAQALHPLIANVSLAMQLFLYLGIILLFSTLFFRYFERPILMARPDYPTFRTAAASA
jgi:peptidoglycan/LPS O-acetylase OafA/YrhL